MFQKNRIYPESSHRLKNLLGKNDWTSMFGEIIVENSVGISTSFEGLRRELDKLNKRILIIFEDVDRIFEKDTIQKIFAISEKMSCERLHVVFQYDFHLLEKKGFDREYLEKYIPYTINLTAISYEKLVKYLWEELGMENTPLKSEKVYMIGHYLPGIHEANHILGVDMDISIDFTDAVTIRKVRIFLSELKKVLSDNDELVVKENVETVLHIIFIKHFFYSYYDLLRIGESPLQSLKLVFEGKEYTMPEILAKFRKQKGENEAQWEERLQAFRTLMDESENRNVWGLLLLLGYELQIEQIEGKLDEITTESVQNLKKKEKNEKIDRIVWNVLANGTSELTDTENALNKLQQDVLLKTGEEREGAWKKYMDDMFHEELWKDNRTIFRLGLDSFLPLFQALEIVGANGRQWEMFLEFYFSKYQKGADKKTISVELIDNCNYCNLRNKKVFFQVIRFINQLEVEGNLNGERTYKLFFKNYMGAVTTLGYSRRMESWMFELPENLEQSHELAEELIRELREQLVALQEEQELDYVKEEFSDLIRFVEKNQELIQCENPISKRRPSFQISEMHSKWAHQDEVDRLISLRENQQLELFWAELEKSYREGKLYLPELQAILKGE